MKRMRLVGIITLVLAGIVLVTGVFSLMLRADNGLFSGLRENAEVARQTVAKAQADVDSAASALKKADTAASEAGKARTAAEDALASIQETRTAVEAGEVSADDDFLRSLYAAAERAQAGVDPLRDGDTQEQEAVEAVDTVTSMAETLLLDTLRADNADAAEGMDKAMDALDDARTAVRGVFTSLGMDAPDLGEDAYPVVEAAGDAVLIDAVEAEAQALLAQADWLDDQGVTVNAAARQAQAAAEANQQGVSIATGDRFINWLSTYFILLIVTGVLLLAIGIVFTFFAGPFLRLWKGNPVFSTFIALMVMMIVQMYSMKFTYNTFGEWAKFWFDNAFNVLRANTSVGMVALGMTMVIITGGIDLAVGSTLAGVGTVLMVLIDTSPRGILLGLGITGIPAYILGILGGLLTGALIGALIGLGVTKGRVPPFIITLGVMNIVRSVAQYFTKSYTPKVPAEFTAISNTVIFGQRLLPIIYWLVLAVLMSIMMQRTRFGRYIYAVGSNERTTRLSGINVDAVKFKVYTLMGVLVSIAAITQVSRLGGMDVASSGSGYELDAIAAVVVGGTSMSGGRGSIIGTVIGVLIIGVMNNLLILLGVDSFLTNAFKGMIVIAAVLMQRKEA